MLSGKLVSIVIPNYNSQDFIVETLASIREQDYSRWECIIVDDYSTDKSFEIINDFIKNDSRFLLVKRPEDRLKGANACRNYGFEISKGDYINWFDSDDVMLPNFISSKIEALDGKTVFVIASCFFTNHDFSVKKYIPLDYKNNLFREYLMWRFKIVTNSILFKKSFLEAYNFKFDERIFKGQEMELFSRIFFQVANESTLFFKVLDMPTFLYRGHAQSSTSKNQIYNPKFKSSEIYTHFENLRFSMILRDNELIQSRYRLIINTLKKAVDNEDEKNKNTILVNLEKVFYSKNYFKITMLKLTVVFFSFSKLKFIPWDKFFKKMGVEI